METTTKSQKNSSRPIFIAFISNLGFAIVELLFGICRMHHRQHGKHHSLVTGRKVIEELFHFFLLLENHSQM